MSACPEVAGATSGKAVIASSCSLASPPELLTFAQSRQLLRLRWTAFLIVGLAYVLSFFHRFAPAAISGDLQQTFHASASELGGLAATYFYVYTLMQIPTGILADTLGPRRVVAIGGLIAGAGSLLAATPLAWALSFISWRTAFVAVDGFSLLLGALSWWLVRDHPGQVALPSLRELYGKMAHPPRSGHWYDGLLIVLKNRAT